MRMNEPSRMGCELCGGHNDFLFRRDTQPFPDNWAVAMAYVPMQTDTAVYDCAQALCEGTLFPCLNKPLKRGCMK